MINAFALLTAANLFAASVAPAASNMGNPLLPQVRAGLPSGEFVENVLQAFDELAGKGGVINAKEMRHRQTMEVAARRADAIGTLLRYDLDGDQSLTIAELYTATGTAPAKRARKAVSVKLNQAERLMLRYDVNRDGAIAMTEVAQAAAAEERPARSDDILSLLNSALAKDGKLTRAEVKAYAQRTFKTVDADRNGHISSEEYAALNATMTVASK